MEKDFRLYMPSNISSEKQQIKGFGAKEIKNSVIVGLTFFIIAFILYIITGNYEKSIYLVMAGFSIPFFLIRKDENIGLSVFEYILIGVDFIKRQKTYRYKYTEWWEKYIEEKS